MKIVLLRNDSDTALELQKQLHDLEYEVILAGNVKNALRLIDSDLDVDVVISSYWLGTGTGTADALIKTLKSVMNSRWLPVLMMCDNWKQEGVVKCWQLHVSGIMALPIGSESLKAKISLADNSGRRRILVVDDEPLILDLLNDHLTLDRHKVATAMNVDEAMNIVSDQKIDLIVSDILMPGMTGIKLLEDIKTNPKTENIPVILITGHSGKFTPDFALAQGADGYLTKPFHNVDLRYTVQSVLSKHHVVVVPVQSEQVRVGESVKSLQS